MVRAAVVIPTHKPELSWFERISLDRSIRVLGMAGYPIIFVVPESSDFEYIHRLQACSPIKGNCFAERFPDTYFKTADGYNLLMMTAGLYECFSDYDYILVCQLDAFVFSDELERFCRMGYDYIGAPWPFWCTHYRRGVFLRVGNGGFSLRRVGAFHRLLSEHRDMVAAWDRPLSEDVFFAWCGRELPGEFRVAPVSVPWQFA